MIINAADDADGDHIRCRWAESHLEECGEVCRVFPAILTETDVSFNFCIEETRLLSGIFSYLIN